MLETVCDMLWSGCRDHSNRCGSQNRSTRKVERAVSIRNVLDLVLVLLTVLLSWTMNCFKTQTDDGVDDDDDDW